MSEDKIVSISSASNIRPEDIVRKSFTVVKRGYDPDQIRIYLEQIAAELSHLIERETRLRQQVHEMQTAQDKPPVVDEETITKILGQETAKILSSAREAARDLLARTSSEAAETKSQAQKLLEQKLQEAETLKSDILESANKHYSQVMDQAESEKEALLAEVKEKCRLMVNEAQVARERILGDLIRKRRVLNTQVEQLRTGKDVILDSLTNVKDDIENLSDTLIHIEQEAKYAAEQSGLRVSLEDDPTEAELMKLSESMDFSKSTSERHSTLESGPAKMLNPVQNTVKATIPEGKLISKPVTQPIAQIDISNKIAQEMIDQVDADDDSLRIIGYETSESSESIISESIQDNPIEINYSEDNNSKSNDQNNSDPFNSENDSEITADSETNVQELEIQDGTDEISSPHDETISEADPDNEQKPIQDKSAAVEDIFKQLKQTQSIEQNVSEANQLQSDSKPHLSDEVVAPEMSSELTSDKLANNTYELSAKELIDGLVVNLIRKVKRAINDEQNELLDGLRKIKNATLDSVMDKQKQSSNFFEVISPILIQAEFAGKEFSKTMSADSGIKFKETPANEYQKMADEMANLLTNSLRQKVSFEMNIKSEDDKHILSEELSSAYREWKNEKIEPVAADFIYACFNYGIFSSFETGTQLTWLNTRDEPECPDCQDNALQKMQIIGEQWPTGQLYPPAHPGCRCLLVITIG